MGRKNLKIPKWELENLYLIKKSLVKDIAHHFSCTDVTIRTYLQRYKIERRWKGFSHIKYPKKDFCGTPEEKAYLVGFRIGDLNIYKPKGKSRTIIARCHTTQMDQVEVMKRAFSPYGHLTVSVSSQGNSFHINCYLNESFEFLLPKENIAVWIRKKPENFFAFIAGYTDAEGNFLLNQERARFKIDSYDFPVLDNMKRFLISKGIHVKFRCIAKKGTNRGNQQEWNKDLWRLNINEANSLKSFIQKTMPYLKHKKRKQDALFSLKNIDSRIKHGTIK